MNVDRKNFAATFPHFLKLLDACEFYAIDEEMTGITISGLKESITSSPKETYECKKQAAARYGIIQVGITLFQKQASPPSSSSAPGGGVQHYLAHPFNFIVFPRPIEDPSLEEDKVVSRDVVLNPSTMNFLTRHKMDFQQWIYTGIPFVDGPNETVLRNWMEERQQAMEEEVNGNAEESLDVLCTDEERQWLQDALKSAETLLSKAEEAWRDLREHSPHLPLSSAAIPGGSDVMLPAQRSRVVRDALTAELKARFPNISVQFKRQGTSYSAVLHAQSSEELDGARQIRETLKQRELLDTLGFRLVFDALVKSRKPVVGHNCFADLLFLMHSLHKPLPDSLPAWKREVQECFPLILDTKYITSQQDAFPAGRFPRNYLGGFFEVYGFHSNRVSVSLPLGFQAYDPLTLLSGRGRGGAGSSSSGGVLLQPAHEAGFDSLMTGILLLNLLAEVGSDMTSVPERWRNKVALFRSLYSVDLNRVAKAEVEEEEEEEYTRAPVVEISHDASVKSSHVESLLLATEGLTSAALYPVQETQTIAVLPYGTSAEELVRQLNERHMGRLTASVYDPKRKMRAQASTPPPVPGARFALPGEEDGKGLLGKTPRLLMRRFLRK